MVREDNLRRWALKGAVARLKEVEAEVAAIYEAFPELRGQSGAMYGDGAGSGGKRRRFSAEGKKAISEGMRKYWARRKAKAAKAAGK